MLSVLDAAIEVIDLDASSIETVETLDVVGRVLCWLASASGTTQAHNAAKVGGSSGRDLTKSGSDQTITGGATLRLSFWTGNDLGTGTLYGLYAGLQTGRGIGGVVLRGVQSVSSIFTNSHLNNANASVTATTKPGDTVFGGLWTVDFGGGGPTITEGSGQETLATDFYGGYPRLHLSRKAATGVSTTLNWTISGTGDRTWLAIAVAVEGTSTRWTRLRPRPFAPGLAR